MGYVLVEIHNSPYVFWQIRHTSWHFLHSSDSLYTLLIVIRVYNSVNILINDNNLKLQRYLFNFWVVNLLLQNCSKMSPGSGYFVVTPDTNRLSMTHNSTYMPTNASWLPYHPMYVPVFSGQMSTPGQSMMVPAQSMMLGPGQMGAHAAAAARAHMRSISCQVSLILHSIKIGNKRYSNFNNEVKIHNK